MLLVWSNIILTALALYSLFYVIKGFVTNSVNGYSFFLPVFILFYICPLLTDYITGFGFSPVYRHVIEALENESVSVIYNLYISILLIFFLAHSKKIRSNDLKNYLSGSQIEVIVYRFLWVYKKYFRLLFFVLFIPIVLVFTIGDLDFYSLYSERKNAYNDLPEAHLLISKFILLGVVLIAFLITSIILDKKYNRINRSFLIPFLIILLIIFFWIHGKRSIVANYLIIQYTFFIISKAISARKILRQLLIVTIAFVGFLFGYGKNIAAEAFRTYWGLRLDFSRDYGVKFSIYNDLLLDRRILPYDFASFLFNISFYVPRTVWPSKPQPYAVYFTNSAFGEFGNDKIYGWGLTTSIFNEHISNLGWIGMVTAPIFIYFIFKFESRSLNPFFKLLSILIGILLIVLQPMPFMVLILLYLFLLFKERKKFVK